jgi:hypothetical protein
VGGWLLVGSCFPKFKLPELSHEEIDEVNNGPGRLLFWCYNYDDMEAKTLTIRVANTQKVKI